MSDLFRDAPIGQIIRLITKNKLLQYPEEKPDFKFTADYLAKLPAEAKTLAISTPTHTALVVDNEEKAPATTTSSNTATGVKDEEIETVGETIGTSEDADTSDDESTTQSLRAKLTMSRILSRPIIMERTVTMAEVEQAYTAALDVENISEQACLRIKPQVNEDGITIVDWYSTTDPENPQHYSKGKKWAVVLQLYLYTLAVYMGSAIYTPAVPYIEHIYHTIPVVSSLGLALYVLGYGIGPLLFSPLSEIPVIGRNPPYMATFAIFVILCIPTALIDNLPGFLVLRFFQGFFGSPCLSTGGASIGDMYSLIQLPYFLAGWAGFATGGPALGPLISGFSVPVKGWRWSIWEIMWLSGPVFTVMMFFFPETSAPNILLRRAARLRKLTGNPNLKAQSEIDQAKLSTSEVVTISLWRPIQINFLDPAIAFTSLYISLVYAIFYSFFEVFPLVYGPGGYDLNAGQIGLIFLNITVGVLIAIPCYFTFLRYHLEPKMKKFGFGAPEERLIPALFASFLTPIGLFMFAWTSKPSIHWIVPTIGVTIYTVGIFLIIQCVFVYIAMTYPEYAASLFAGNDFCRSALAAGAILFSRPLFLNLGISEGVTLLAGLTVSGVIGIFVLWYYGANLRARSRFAANKRRAATGYFNAHRFIITDPVAYGKLINVKSNLQQVKMDSIALSQGTKYHFVTYTGAPTTDPITRKLAKQDVMQHIRRRSKVPPVIRRHAPLKCDLDVPQTFIEKPAYPSERLDLVDRQIHSFPTGVLPGPDDSISLETSARDRLTKLPTRRSFTISRLGSGRGDPFIKFPIELNSRSRELIDLIFDERTGKASPLKVAWFQIGMLDGAAFHQLLSGAATYFNNLRHGDGGQANGEFLAHHAYSLQLVNSQMREVETATTDGVISSIIGFACYYHLIEDMESWRKHLAGLREIVRLRGGIDTFESQGFLGTMLSCIDISGSCTLDEAPSFPVPGKPTDFVLPMSPTTSSYPFHSPQVHLLTINSIFDSGFIDSMADLNLESLHLQEEIQNTGGNILLDSMYICDYINPLLHKLLSLPRQDISSPTGAISEMMRLAAVLYLIAIRQSFGIYPTRVAMQIHKLSALIMTFEGSGASQNIWADHELSLIELWVTAVGCIMSDEKSTASWFATRLHAAMRRISVATYGDLEDILRGFSWIDEIHSTLLGAFRRKLSI
ncbi:hypothetical protein VTL71DRAFT_15982 [Oculimacula yallundae]|uniref:Major facilitator superfamily (MFS) profile domain-containing protein n=1 Tax=Oculimacula yallundae TaxID=86028 RepID=A0ABR4CD70_9HELO